MGINDALDDGQAKSGSMGLGGEERLEQVAPLFGREAWPVVVNDDGDGGLLGPVGRSPFNVDHHRVMSRGERVLQDVAKDLDEPERVDGAGEIRIAPFLEQGIPPGPARRGDPRPRARGR